MKKIKEGLNEWRDMSWSCVKRLNVVKMPVLLIFVYVFMQFLSQPQIVFL